MFGIVSQDPTRFEARGEEYVLIGLDAAREDQAHELVATSELMKIAKSRDCLDQQLYITWCHTEERVYMLLSFLG